MKLKSLAVLSVVGLLSLSTGCKYSQAELDSAVNVAYTDGYNEGYDDGYVDGDADGFSRAQTYFATADYNSGFSDGTAAGYNTGFSAGSASGYTTGYNNGYDDGYVDGDANGYTDGYNNGYDDGFFDGDSIGYTDGYNAGYDDGNIDGYNLGYDDGFYDGYDIGYDDGWSDGFGFSVKPALTSTKNAKVNLLSKVHNSLVNVSKIKAPVVTAKGLEVNGNLIFEETSMISKDLEKRAAVAEKYLVLEMSKQIKSQFGLSEERALKIAKISNHWRKFSSSRAVSAEDADAFSTELLGANMKEIESAVKGSLSGETSELNNLIGKAAAVNQTSPEQISQIMNQLFF
jgi:flagellar biosynthesis/type III secretory pathway protein FliH